MGWTTETAKILAEMMEEQGLSTREIGDAMGRSHNYVWKRLGSRQTGLSLEDVEAFCEILRISPEELLRDARRRG